MGTVGGSIGTVQLLLLSGVPLLIKGLLALDGHEETLGFDEFRVVRTDTLFLHLLIFLRQD